VLVGFLARRRWGRYTLDFDDIDDGRGRIFGVLTFAMDMDFLAVVP
jgi:hypothetical protein